MCADAGHQRVDVTVVVPVDGATVVFRYSRRNWEERYVVGSGEFENKYAVKEKNDTKRGKLLFDDEVIWEICKGQSRLCRCTHRYDLIIW